MHNVFSLKDIGEVHYFLRIEISKTKNRFHLNQHKYITQLLGKTQLSDSKAILTPMTLGTASSTIDGQHVKDSTQYRLMVRTLQYYTLTRLIVSIPKLSNCYILTSNEEITHTSQGYSYAWNSIIQNRSFIDFSLY